MRRADFSVGYLSLSPLIHIAGGAKSTPFLDDMSFAVSSTHVALAPDITEAGTGHVQDALLSSRCPNAL